MVVSHCRYELLYELEPWCSTIYVDTPLIDEYIKEEQPNTLFNLRDRVQGLFDSNGHDIIVEFSAREFTPQQFNYLAQLPEILSNDEELEVGEFELGIFTVTVNKIKTYEEDLIVCER